MAERAVWPEGVNKYGIGKMIAAIMITNASVTNSFVVQEKR